MYRCSCEPGWTGKTCAIGSCHSNPCQHGGTCSVDAAEVAKVNLCEDAADCKNMTALAHGLGLSCAELPQSVRQFGKKKLSLASYCPSACVGRPCKTGAMLHSASPRYTCTCASGYYGPSCELHRCADDPVWKYAYGGIQIPCSTYTAPFLRPSCKTHTGKDAKGQIVTAAVACPKSCAICTSTKHTACLSSPCQHGGSCQDVSQCIDQHQSCPTIKAQLAALGNTCSTVLNVSLGVPALAGKRLRDECCATCGGGLYQCKCTSAYTGPECQKDKSKSTIIAELRQKAVLNQCARSAPQGLNLLPVDTAISNFTLNVVRDLTIDDCQQKCCEDARCVSFVYTTSSSATKSGVCKLKSLGLGCDCHCDKDQSTQAPDCEYAKMAPKCSKMCDDTPRGDTLFTVTHPSQPLQYCTLNVFQRGMANFSEVFGAAQGNALIGTMSSYMLPFARTFNFENICRSLYQKLEENEETVCDESIATGLASSPQTKIVCNGDQPHFVVLTLCARPCMADKTCASALATARSRF